MVLESVNSDLFITDQYRLIFSFLNKNFTKSVYRDTFANHFQAGGYIPLPSHVEISVLTDILFIPRVLLLVSVIS
jgi:hypothetical protein